MAGLENLSDRDRAVLRSIFDPTATIGDVADDGDNFVDDDQGSFSVKSVRRNTQIPSSVLIVEKAGDDDEENSFSKDLSVTDSTETEQQSKALCLQGVQLAEAGKYEEALTLLSKGIEIAPERAAGYNDRAQLFRLMKRDQDAMKDLDHVLQVTEGKATRARALALCQRGVLSRKRGSDDEARAAFAEAAKLGSGFAKKQVVELNPYAALCNQMLSQVMKGEKDIKL